MKTRLSVPAVFVVAMTVAIAVRSATAQQQTYPVICQMFAIDIQGATDSVTWTTGIVTENPPSTDGGITYRVMCNGFKLDRPGLSCGMMIFNWGDDMWTYVYGIAYQTEDRACLAPQALLPPPTAHPIVYIPVVGR